MAAKLGFLSSLTALVAALAIATVSAPTEAADSCQHKEFKTVLVSEACKSGGQAAAKDAMKKFMKEAKIKTCNQCHAKLAPSYELKKDAFDQFKNAGGKLLDDKAAAK